MSVLPVHECVALLKLSSVGRPPGGSSLVGSPKWPWPLDLTLLCVHILTAAAMLPSMLLQVSLVGSAATFAALIIILCCMVAVAFILSVFATFKANTWLLKVLDVDKDGKVSGKDLLESASKLFHLGIQHVPGKDDPRSPDGKSGTAASTSTASSKGSVWKGAVLFFSKHRLAGAQADAAAAQDAAAPDDRSAHDQACPGSAGSAAAGSASPGAGRISPLLGRSPRLVANSLPITNAAAASATGSPGAGPAAPGDGGVPTSSSIDMGMLAMLRQMNGAGSFNGTAAMPAAGGSLEHNGGRQQPQHFVAVDLGQFSNSAALQRERRQQQQQQPVQQQPQQGHPAVMGRANSMGALGASGGRMPLHAYMSVQQWLEQSIDLAHGPRHPDMAASGSLDQSRHPSGLSPGSRVNSTGRSRSLQLSASTPAPQVAALRSSSGSLALQRAQLIQQFQQQQQQHYADRDSCGGHESGNIAEEAVDLSTLPGTESHLSTPQRQRQQRRRTTGPAAAARAREIAAAAAAAAPSEGDVGVQGQQGTAPTARHQPYYALWSNIASAITGPTGSADSTAAGGRPPAAASGYTSSKTSERQQSSQSSSRRGVAGASSSITRSSAGTRGMPSSGFATGSIGSSSNSSRPRQSPFAAADVAAAATGPSQAKGAGMRPSPFAAAAAALGQGGPVGSSVPAARAASAPDCHAATAALAAAAAGAPSVSKGRHSSYYSMWQAATGEVSGDASAAAGPAVAAAALQQPQQQSGPGMTAQAAATAPPVVLEPRRHKQYIGLWSALAEELGDGPSAVGAATPGPVVPSEVAAAFAAAMASSSNVGSVSAATAAVAPQTSAHVSSSSSSHVPRHQPGRVRPSPFATMSAAAAVIGEDVAVGEAVGDNVQQQREQQRQRHRRRPGRRPRDSAGTCLGSDSD